MATGTHAAGVEAFRSLRAELEASVLPLATSLDGRRFSFQAGVNGLALRLGGYAMLEGDGRRPRSARSGRWGWPRWTSARWGSRPRDETSTSARGCRSASRVARA